MSTRTALPLILAALTCSEQLQAQLVLQDGTPVRLRLSRNLTSADAQVGETVDFEVLEDVVISGVPVVAKGTAALGTVTEARPKRRMGRAGKLNVVIDHVRLTTGEKAALRAVKDSAGGSNVGKMTGAIVATSIVFFPAAPLFLLAHGKDITIPKGTEITAYVNGDMKVELKNTHPVASNEDTAKQIAVTNDDIVKLIKAGFSDDVVIARVLAQDVNFKVDAESLIELKSAGVSEKVISAMLQKTAN